MKKTIARIFVFILVLAIPSVLYPSSPSYMPLQGYLQTSDGSAVDGLISINFAIYATETGGEPVWSEMQSVLVDQGFFTVYLGEVEALDLSIFRDHGDLWLGVQVGTDAEMDRIYLGSAPFSAYAQYCGNITESIPPELLPDSVATGAQSCLGDDKVVGIDITGSLVCATDQDTTYLAGNGLVLTGVTFSVDTSVVQSRISSECPAGSSIRRVNADGTVVCEPDNDTRYDAGSGIALSGTTFSLETSYYDGSAHDGRFVNVSGDSMTGELTLPADGLTVGTNQLTCSGGNVGIGTSTPQAPLHVVGNLLGAVKGPLGEPLRIAVGRTTPGSTNWVQYSSDGLYVDVDTSSAGFTSTPYYFTSLGGNISHWATTGATSIYYPTSNSFRVYVKFTAGTITPAQANRWGWHINWTAIGR